MTRRTRSLLLAAVALAGTGLSTGSAQAAPCPGAAACPYESSSWLVENPGSLLRAPSAVAVDGAGNRYVADTTDDRVSKFSPAGELLLVIGTPGSGPGELGAVKGLAVDGTDLLVADGDNARISRWSTTHGAYLGAFGQGDLEHPTGIAASATHFYVSDSGGAGSVKRFAKTGVLGLTAQMSLGASYEVPAGIAVDPSDGHVLVADTGNERVVELNAALGGVSQLGTTGAPGDAAGQLDGPVDVAPVPGGGLVVAERDNDRLQAFSAAGAHTGFAGTAGAGALDQPTAVAVGGGEVLAADRSRALRFDTNGGFVGALGSSGHAPGAVSSPAGVTALPGGGAWVTEAHDDRVQRFAADGTSQAVQAPATLDVNSTLSHAAVGGDGSLWVPSAKDDEVVHLAADGTVLGAVGTPDADADEHEPGELDNPRAVALGPDGHLYVSDPGGDRITVLTTGGAPVRSLGGIADPAGVAFAPDGTLVVTDRTADVVHRLGADGTPIATYGSPGGGLGQLDSPSGVVVGADGDVWVADTANARVARFGADGTAKEGFGERGLGLGRLRSPRDLALSGTTLLVADGLGNAIQRFVLPAPPKPQDPKPPVDTTAPKASLKLSGKLGTLRRGKAKVSCTLSEPGRCVVTAKAGGRKLGSVTIKRTAPGTGKATLKLSKAARKRLKGRSAVRVTLSATATDLAGNAAKASLKRKVRR